MKIHTQIIIIKYKKKELKITLACVSRINIYNKNVNVVIILQKYLHYKHELTIVVQYNAVLKKKVNIRSTNAYPEP